MLINGIPLCACYRFESNNTVGKDDRDHLICLKSLKMFALSNNVVIKDTTLAEVISGPLMWFSLTSDLKESNSTFSWTRSSSAARY